MAPTTRFDLAVRQLLLAAAISGSPAHASELSLATNIHVLPARDALVAAFPREWNGSDKRPYGAFYEPAWFRDVPITDAWNDGILDIQADPEELYLGWWLQLPNVDWSAFRRQSIALRVRFSDRMYRRFKVELKSPDTAATWFVDLADRQIAEMRERGFGDILLPLREAEGAGALKAIRELVLVFAGGEVATVAGRQTKGELKLHSIRLTAPPHSVLKSNDRIDRLAAQAFDWFEHYRNPESGLVPDRAANRHNAGVPDSRRLICSIASVGYYLSMLPDAVAIGRLSEAQARERALTVLRFFESHAETRAGLFYHFIDMSTGKSLPGVEASALDSAILFNGCMVAGVRFGGEVARLGDRLLARVDWREFRRPATQGKPELLAFGWKPGRGMLGPMDVRSTELAMAYFLAVGAAEMGIEPELWWNTRIVWGDVAGRKVLHPTHGIFTSYYGLGWFNLAGLKDRDGIDLWRNAVDAALANREFSRTESGQAYSSGWGGWWGISAGDSPKGYFAPGLIRGQAAGTVWPMTALAALPWAEEEIAQDLKRWQESPVWEFVDGPFGLAPFNLDAGWVGGDLIGIDLGSFYINVANHRRQTVWNLWKQHPVARRALQRIYP